MVLIQASGQIRAFNHDQIITWDDGDGHGDYLPIIKILFAFLFVAMILLKSFQRAGMLIIAATSWSSAQLAATSGNPMMQVHCMLHAIMNLIMQVNDPS